MPAGLQGVTAVFDFFIASVNEKLSAQHLLDFDPASRLVQRAVENLVDAMTRVDETWLPRDEARKVADALLPSRGYENSLFRHLLAEGVIAEDIAPNDASRGERIDSVHFSYERLSDHLRAKRMLDEHLDPSDPVAAFDAGKPLGALVGDEHLCWENRGVVEALSVQLPERVGRELLDCAPRSAEWQMTLECFVESLVWRAPAAFGDSTLEHINEHVLTSQELHHKFLDALLTIATTPRHPYNADFLHRNLEGHILADRDQWWSTYLHEQYSRRDHSPARRLVDWAWSATDKQHISDDAIRLAATALAWFLTTSNRFLRDRATKALVAILTTRLDVLRTVLQRFRDVDDPYVAERLYAVAYGCAMRSTDARKISQLAADVYSYVFEGGEPPVHILLRDYARGVIETALHRGVELRIDLAKIRPPYKSAWNDELPSKEELQAKHGVKRSDRSDEEMAQSEIINSVTLTDFSRYVIGTNSGHFDWTSRKLSESPQPAPHEIFEEFVASLTPRQKEAFDELVRARHRFRVHASLHEEHRREFFHEDIAEDVFREILANLEQRFRATLRGRKKSVFDEHVLACLDDLSRGRNAHRFDLTIAQRWILRRIFELGWTADRFRLFDRNVNRWTDDHRTAHKPERIGKKYQWIAHHEFLARVADNFEYKSDGRSGGKEKYEGPWQPSARDIDPSCLLKRTGREVWKHRTNTWWFPVAYHDWGEEWGGSDCDNAWLKRTDDLPPVESLIETTNPANNSKWLTLESYYKWEQPLPVGEDSSESRRKELWYILRSYIVRRADLEDVLGWAREQDFSSGKLLPESHPLHGVFLGEFFQSPAYEYHNIPYYNLAGWTRGYNDHIPGEVLVTTEQYARDDSGFDCSMDDGYSIYLPTKLIADRMGLRSNGIEGSYLDSDGELTCLDPSVRSAGPGALLIDKRKFLKFLDDEDYGILWIVQGEKSDFDYGSHGNDRSGRLMINGAYTMRDGEVRGDCAAKFYEH